MALPGGAEVIKMHHHKPIAHGQPKVIQGNSNMETLLITLCNYVNIKKYTHKHQCTELELVFLM